MTQVRILWLIIFFSLLLISCKNPLMTSVFGINTTTFNSNGGSAIPSQQLLRGETVTRPRDPVRINYLFDGWFEDNNTFEKAWDFKVTPDRDMTLFAKWLAITGLEVYSNPEKLTYNHGETLDLSGLVVTLIYGDGSEIVNVPFTEFASRSIVAIPAHGDLLVRSSHNGVPVTIQLDSFTVVTSNLIVNRVTVTEIVFPAASDITFGQTLSNSILTGGSTELGSFEWENPNYSPSVGISSFSVIFTPGDVINYDYSNIQDWNGSIVSRDVSVSISKAAGSAVTAPDFTKTNYIITITNRARLVSSTAQLTEYTVSLFNNEAPAGLIWKDWVSDVSFDVTPGNTYYLYARSKESQNYNAGPVWISTGIIITIPDGTSTISITIEQIKDINYEPDPISISRSAAAPDNLYAVEIDLNDLESDGFDITSIVWRVGNNTPKDKNTVSADELDTFVINAADFISYSLGGHSLRLTIYKVGAPTVQDMKNKPFTISN